MERGWESEACYLAKGLKLKAYLILSDNTRILYTCLRRERGIILIVNVYYCKLYFCTGTQLIFLDKPLGIEKSFYEITRIRFEPRTFGMTPNHQH